jgi:hypothetical protein
METFVRNGLLHFKLGNDRVTTFHLVRGKAQLTFMMLKYG